MSKRSITIEEVPLLPPNGSEPNPAKRHYLDVEVTYDDGKALFSGPRQRGYRLRVSPVWEEKTDVPGLVMKASRSLAGKACSSNPLSASPRRHSRR